MQLILGTAQLTACYGLRSESVATANGDPVGFLHVAVGLGFDALDTAPTYGDAEAVIGRSGTGLEVHTKIPTGTDPLRSIEESLERLQRSTIDLAYLHDPDAPLVDDGAGIEQVIIATRHLVNGFGASVYEAPALTAALARDDLAAVQIPANVLAPQLLHRGAGRQNGVRLIARSVLCQGLLLLNPADVPRSLKALVPALRAFHRCCHDLERPPLEVALLWARDHPNLDGLVLGAGSLAQLREMAGALAAPALRPEERQAVGSIALPEPRSVDPRFWATTEESGEPQGGRPRVVAIVQARLGSTRFPDKVLAEIGGTPALLLLLRRLRRARSIDEIVVAIPDSEANDRLDQTVTGWGFSAYRGSEQDVLDRYVCAAAAHDADVILRITGDCPFIDPAVVDLIVDRLEATGADDVRTADTFPDGFDVEAITKEILRRAGDSATDPYDREHVTPWIRRHARLVDTLDYGTDLSGERVTLDEPEDLVVLRKVLGHLQREDFSVDDVAALMQHDPQLFDENRHLLRNEGAEMGSGQKLWRRARRVIPGGNMLLSKRAEQFLPEGWPSYFSRAKGCEVWDLDGERFIDMSLMGVGTNILGYGHPKVDEAVRRVVADGNLSTLNCPEEVYLAERLCDLHPWADMAKFTRSGGEACAVAVRIARAASGKPAVAICGYHGWHDWYLSANLADDSALDGHLLPGLPPNGIPRSLKGLTRPFLYNDLPALEHILEDDDVGVVIMEVERSTPPAPGFLEGARELTRRKGVVLIFDECTSGFRKVLGGLHLHYGIEPDLATFGKTLGNGYAINAVIGRREVVEHAENTFISSTFWTERIGPTAALASLDAMAEEDAPARVEDIGNAIRSIWRKAASSAGFTLGVSGLPALSVFAVDALPSATLRTILTEQMLAAGYLATPAVYACLAHTTEVMERYGEALEATLLTMTPLANETAAPSSEKDLSGSGFGRLA